MKHMGNYSKPTPEQCLHFNAASLKTHLKGIIFLICKNIILCQAGKTKTT